MCRLKNTCKINHQNWKPPTISVRSHVAKVIQIIKTLHLSFTQFQIKCLSFSLAPIYHWNQKLAMFQWRMIQDNSSYFTYMWEHPGSRDLCSKVTSCLQSADPFYFDHCLPIHNNHNRYVHSVSTSICVILVNASNSWLPLKPIYNLFIICNKLKPVISLTFSQWLSLTAF